MPLQITITLDGTPYTRPAGCIVGDFLCEQGLRPERLAIEYNGRDLTPAEAAHLLLRHGDQLRTRPRRTDT